MKAADTSGWAFEPRSPDDESEIECPECKAWSPLSLWREGEIYCEDCGEHAAMVCPACGERFDIVWSDDRPMNVRDQPALEEHRE